jgi:hypothetical protein
VNGGRTSACDIARGAVCCSSAALTQIFARKCLTPASHASGCRPVTWQQAPWLQFCTCEPKAASKLACPSHAGHSAFR